MPPGPPATPAPEPEAHGGDAQGPDLHAYSHVTDEEYEASALVLLHVSEQGDRSLREALALTAGGVLARNDRSFMTELAVLQNSTDFARGVADVLHAQQVTRG